MTDPVTDPLPGVPRRAFSPGAALCGAMALAFLLTGGEMAGWGISQGAIDQGRWWTAFTSLFAHGTLLHLIFNLLVLFFVSGPIVARMGQPPASWVRYALLFTACGLGGSIAYVLFNVFETVPAVGASGAIFGMVGLMARLPRSSTLAPAEYWQPIRPVTGELLAKTAFLLAIISLPGILTPGFMGMAWEAHLGGFVVGFFAGPLFLPRPSYPPAYLRQRMDSENDAS